MPGMITREEAVQLISHSSKKEHLLLVAALMKKLACRLGEDQTEWELVGLLHDLDFDQTASDGGKHGLLAASQLKGRLPEPCLHAIRAHDFRTGVKPESRLDLGLITADTLIHYILKEGSRKATPLQAMNDAKSQSLERPWIMKNILLCRELGIEPVELIRLAQDTQAQ